MIEIDEGTRGDDKESAGLECWGRAVGVLSGWSQVSSSDLRSQGSGAAGAAAARAAVWLLSDCSLAGVWLYSGCCRCWYKQNYEQEHVQEQWQERQQQYKQELLGAAGSCRPSKTMKTNSENQSEK